MYEMLNEWMWNISADFILAIGKILSFIYIIL